MDGDLLLTLSIAKQYAHQANFAGTPRQAIADGYSAIDAMFTALLRQASMPQPRNHWQKFCKVRHAFPNVFEPYTVKTSTTSTTYSPGTDYESLREFYNEWLQSRYSKFEMTAADASARVREALNVVNAGIRHLAPLVGLTADELEERVSTKAFGFDFSEVSVAVGDAHERLFAAAEAAGEERGSRLGTKLAATTNYCELDVMAGDDLNQRVIKDDKDIADEAARVYHAFVDLIDRIQEKRLAVISGGKPVAKCTPDEVNMTPDFMFAMKARYHGGKTTELGARWFGQAGKVFKDLFANFKFSSLKQPSATA